MKWQGRRESDNVEDRRGISGGKIAVGGGIVGIIFLVIQMFMGGGDAGQLIQQVQQQAQGSQSTEERPLTPEEVEMGKFIRVIVADNEDVWNKIFGDEGQQYQEPKLILFSGSTSSACGEANTATGPFYCPGDQTVYLDLAFFDLLKSKLGGSNGDFAIAYVIAHEVGHHVQHLMGTADKAR
ncbi:MAG: neutral zinc metallopeptidase, partial [Saprospiraceae bacterium]